MMQKNKILAVPQVAVVCFLAILLSFEAYASDWDIQPGISVTQAYSDNIELSADDEDSDFITSVNPSLSVLRESSRLQLQLDYLMQNLFYYEDSDRNETYHQLDFLSAAEIVKNFFSLEADARIEQALENPRRQTTVRNISSTGNNTDVLTAGITPVVRWDLGGYATANARYRYGVQNYDDDSDVVDGAGDFDDNQSSTANASLGNLEDFDRFGWEVEYQRSHVDFDDRSNITLERTQAEIAYNIARSLTIVGTYGHENNDFVQSPLTDDAEGDYWDAGIVFDITPRNQIEVRRGDRFFGNTWFGAWRYAGRILAFDLEYSEDITSDALNRVRESGVVTNFSNDIDIDSPSDRSSVYESKRVDLDLILTLAKSSYSLSFFRDEREFLDTLNEEESYGVLFAWLWQFAPRTSLGFDAFWGKEKFDEPDDLGDRDTEDSFDVGVDVTRQLGPRTDANLAYSYSEGDTGVGGDEFEANIISVGLSHEF